MSASDNSYRRKNPNRQNGLPNRNSARHSTVPVRQVRDIPRSQILPTFRIRECDHVADFSPQTASPSSHRYRHRGIFWCRTMGLVTSREPAVATEFRTPQESLVANRGRRAAANVGQKSVHRTSWHFVCASRDYSRLSTRCCRVDATEELLARLRDRLVDDSHSRLT